LLDAALLLDPNRKFYERDPNISARFSGEVPLGVRVAIGQLLFEQKPVSGRWALAWLLAHPETRLGSPARRAFPEFCKLFLKRFDSAFPDGLRFEPPKRRLSAQYAAASGSFTVEIQGALCEWPDIRDVRKPLEALHALGEQCAADLAGYSRYLAKEGAERGSLEAAAWLPGELVQDAQTGPLQAARTELQRFVGGERAHLTVRQLVQSVRMLPGDRKLSRKEGQVVSQLLERLGYGVEPDLRVTTVGENLDRPVVVYRLDGHGLPSVQASSVYQSGLLITNLAAIVLHADGNTGPAEEAKMMRQIDAIPGMAPAERVRLKAHAAWLLVEPPGLGRLRGRLAELPDAPRRSLAEFVIAVAAADGAIGPEEVKTIVKIYAAMGLPKERVHSDIHAFHTDGVGEDEPVAVRDAAAGKSRGHRIPRPEESTEASVIRLDMGKIARIQSDTRQAATLLSAIFVEEVPLPEAEVEQQEEINEADSLSGLDGAHAALARELAARDRWPRAEFERLARSLNLLPDGALERINEWAFDRFEEPVIEDGDPLVVRREHIQTLETAA
jgi:uncharacterized tellurite resistance protein B-like protein